VETLRSWGNGEVIPNPLRTGLCDHLEKLLGFNSKAYSFGKTIIKYTIKINSWDHFSGCDIYPIRHPKYGNEEEASYLSCDNMWDIESTDDIDDQEYIRRRLELTLLVADYIEQKYIK